MTPNEYTSILIDSGLLKRIYRDRLNKLTEAKDRFKENLYPAASHVRGKEFVLIRTGNSFETKERIYTEVMIVIDTGNVTIEYKGRRHGNLEIITEINSRENLSTVLVDLTAQNPRKIVRTLRRIDCVIQWYNDRRAGIERSARQTMIQQSKWVKYLSDEITLHSLQQ